MKKTNLVKIINEYRKKIIEDPNTLNTKILFRINEKTIPKTMTSKDIINIQFDRLEQNEDMMPLFPEIFYTLFYMDKKEIIKTKKSIFLINYIAVDYDSFTLDLFNNFLSEINDRVEKFIYSDEIKNTFLKCLSINQNMPDDIKLWLELK